jgi:hypothetical protein
MVLCGCVQKLSTRPHFFKIIIYCCTLTYRLLIVVIGIIIWCWDVLTLFLLLLVIEVFGFFMLFPSALREVVGCWMGGHSYTTYIAGGCYVEKILCQVSLFYSEPYSLHWFRINNRTIKQDKRGYCNMAKAQWSSSRPLDRNKNLFQILKLNLLPILWILTLFMEAS